MDYKKAIETLRPMADNIVLPGIAEALETAIRSMEELDSLRAERDKLAQKLKEVTVNEC